MTTSRWTRRPDGSTWGDWGADDELGRLNLVTREKVLQGIAEVQEGRTFCLSLPLDFPGKAVLNPRRHPPELTPTQRDGRPIMGFPMRCVDPTALDIVSDDKVLLTLQYSTQWDTLAHVGAMFDVDGDGKPEDVFYNGFRSGEHILGPVTWQGTNPVPRGEHVGARNLGVENMATHGMQGRAVLIDLAAHFGGTGRAVGYADLMEVMRKDGVVVESGDFVLLRTGFDRTLLGMAKNPDPAKLFATAPTLDGRDTDLQQWVTESGVVALISDNYGVESTPARPCMDDYCAMLPLHHHCLFKLGVYLGEMWFLSDLADWLRANRRSRVLLTAPPLRLPGAVGSPATPIATV